MKKNLIVQSALASLLLAPNARAQAIDEHGASTTGDIVVTAQRRSERLQDVPMAITALSSDMLEKSGVTNTTDLARVTPGVTMSFYGGFLQPAIRGITSTGANIGENSNVATYIDGIYQPQQIATLIDLPDVEQIEVLKGPQGALYGQNATGGAILISSKSPSFTPTGKFSASYGNYNDVQLRGFVSGPLASGVALSLAGAYQERDGFRRHVLTNQRDYGLKSTVVRGKLLLEPSDSARIILSGFYSDRKDSANYAGFAINGNSIAFAPNLAGLSPFFAGIPVPASPRTVRVDQFSSEPGVFTKIRSYGGSLRGEFDIAGGTLTSSSGYFKNKINYLADVDAASPRILEARAEPLKGEYFVHDTSFASGGTGPVSFLAGIFYLKGQETFVGNISEIFSAEPSPSC
ncbi:TonB-dependent receptor plug domain-containing protein [Novosphingobium sp. G106]|uniref:TonB-dependent receptor n=1 Tax=Novosphingobium sp. G106 TaxID=2849500 RepID=UPI001C2D15CF|nr:TonB-dependent receptor plug domain-containing protein [Novosphingobium sp. G106]MBV1687827.1 TonB-dependent receptor plug domain-containing protein [Novosphingobium sp. G106]